MIFVVAPFLGSSEVQHDCPRGVKVATYLGVNVALTRYIADATIEDWHETRVSDHSCEDIATRQIILRIVSVKDAFAFL